MKKYIAKSYANNVESESWEFEAENLEDAQRLVLEENNLEVFEEEENKMKLKQLGKWEYDCLKRDMKGQGDNWSYKGGFKAWYKEVFLVDEAWEEIRNEGRTCEGCGEPLLDDEAVVKGENRHACCC